MNSFLIFDRSIWLAIKTVVWTFQSVLKWSHDNEDSLSSWSTGDECRVIDAGGFKSYRNLSPINFKFCWIKHVYIILNRMKIYFCFIFFCTAWKVKVILKISHIKWRVTRTKSRCNQTSIKNWMQLLTLFISMFKRR